jgi:apolipoprotein N-acyltransferase
MSIRIVLVLLSAGLQTLALPPFGLVSVAWIALVPMLLALRGLSVRRAAALGLLFGTAAIWGVGYWVPSAFAHYYQQPRWFGVGFALAASVIFAGSYSAGFAAGVAALTPQVRGLRRVTLVACLWVAWELLRARMLTGDPWLLLGYALGPSRVLSQSADLGGVYLLSFLVAFVNAALVEALGQASPRERFSPIVVAVLGLLGAWAYGQARLAMVFPGAAVPVVVVQGNNPVGTQWRAEDYGSGLERYLRLSSEAAERSHPQLFVWPESAVTFFLADDRSYQATIGRLLGSTGADLILGGPFRDVQDGGPRHFNSAFYMTADGRLAGRYDKTHLLPFAEYFPLRTIQLLRRRFERVPFFTAGSGEELLQTRVGPVAAVVCFEAIFPELVRARMARGARLLVNLSNDAWLGTGAGREQHLAMVALRAIENRTWVIRATTTGISAVIDPFGAVVERGPTDVPAALAGTVVPLAIDTVYEAIGDAFAFGCLGLAVVAAIGLWVVRSSSRE